MKKRKILNSCPAVFITAWAVMLALIFTGSPATAFQLDLGSDWSGNFDNTLKYSSAFRLAHQDNKLLASPQNDDGNRNFDTGFVSNRFDILSELDIAYKRSFGIRFSAAAWYDTVYNEENDNDSPATFNAVSVPHDEFTDETETLHGRKAELLDAFAWMRVPIGNMQGTLRAGKHTLLWGESLFMATNGIAYGQSPTDVIKATSVPGSQVKEIIMPLAQISAQLQVLEDLSIAAFYHLEWKQSRIPAAGSYLSSVDLIDEGGEAFSSPPPFVRDHDMEADDSGQWGLSANFRLPKVDCDFGLYYYRFHDRGGQVYIYPVPGIYRLVYPEDIKVYGLSFGTQFGPVNVSGEAHMRKDMPLVSDPQVVLPGMPADNDDNPRYALGTTYHAQISGTYFLSPSFLWDAGIILGEVGWQKLSSITKNPGALDPTRTRDAWGFRFKMEPTYFQVFPGVDLGVPIGFAYSPRGRSSVNLKFNGGGASEGGDVSIGLNATILPNWKIGLNYINYFGSPGTQVLADRDFINFSIQRAF